MKNKPFVVGVTGGIGSGKTAVTDFFARKGIEIVDADLAARVVVEPGKPALTDILVRYTKDILLTDGSLDRRRLRDIIFKDDAERAWLEQLLHPLIREEIIRAIENASSQYVILVSPLMIETNQQALTHRLLVVDLPLDLQIERTMQRDDMTREQTLAIISKQSSREDKLSKADDVVDNSRSIEQLHKQLEALHSGYLITAGR